MNELIIIAGIVTYNPEIKRLKECLDVIVPQVRSVVIVDNGSVNLYEIKELQYNYNFEFVQNYDNLGIAKALNQIFEMAENLCADWIVTLDQDTVVPANLISVYEKNISKFDEAGIFFPLVYDHITHEKWPYIDNIHKVAEFKRCITSGSINKMSAWKKAGGFDEYLFIDEVDNDFCYRVRKNGYRIFLIPELIINHQIGNTEIRTIFGKKIYIRNHSAFRKYYISRNMIYVAKKNRECNIIKAICHAFAFSAKSVLFEKDKITKLKACIHGIYDGVFADINKFKN